MFRRVNAESPVGRICITLHPELSITEPFNLKTIHTFMLVSKFSWGRATVRLSMITLNCWNSYELRKVPEFTDLKFE